MSVEETPDLDGTFPRLSDDELAVLEAAGRRITLREGETLYAAGDSSNDFVALLSGLVAIVDGDEVIGVHGERRFLGELNLVTGEPVYVTTVVREAGEALVLTRDALQRVV